MNHTNQNEGKVYGWLSPLIGDFKERATFRLSSSAEAMISKSFEDILSGALRDYHAHIMGLGEGGTRCYINPTVRKGLHPFDNLRYKVYLNAADIRDKSKADQQFVERLLDLTSGFPNHSKFCLLAFDQHYNKDGTVHKNNTKIYVPNEYVYQLSEQRQCYYLDQILQEERLYHQRGKRRSE